MATEAVTAEGAVGKVQALPQSYTPSWLDTLVARIERLPGPTWSAYILLTVLALAFVALDASLSSRGLLGQDPAYFGYAFFHVYPLAAYYYLSRAALAAWDAFRPATGLDDASAERMRLELSTTPARPALVVYVVGAASFLAMMAMAPEGFDLVGHQPAFVALRVLSEAFWLAPVAWMLGYLLFRQLRIVSQLHRSVVAVDLLKPGPLHAMSKLTARSAIVLLLPQLLGVFVPLPNLSGSVRLVLSVVLLPVISLSVAAFFLPLRGMHALLEAEKDRLQSEVSSRIKSTVATLHDVVDEEAVPTRDAESSRLSQVRIDALNKALASLLQEREFNARLSTWAWDTSTLRAVLAAVVLPIGLFVLTTAIDRFFV
jgi:two-component sensor histidine kinase